MSPRFRRAVARGAAVLAGGTVNHGLRILTYHRVNDDHRGDRLSVRTDSFREQMELLVASGRPVVSLGRALPALSGDQPLPEDALAITFDDGYRDNLDVALPILERLGLPATVFVATGYVGTSATIDRYRGCCSEDRMLGWDDVRELMARGHEVGGHGRRHLELASLGAAEADADVTGCAADLATHTGVAPRLFCYPRGSHSPAVQACVAAHGFEAACTVSPGVNPPSCPLLSLRRTEISADDDIQDFRLKLEGGFDAWHRLAQRLGRREHASRWRA